jgi:hypothetical protein
MKVDRHSFGRKGEGLEAIGENNVGLEIEQTSITRIFAGESYP